MNLKLFCVFLTSAFSLRSLFTIPHSFPLSLSSKPSKLFPSPLSPYFIRLTLGSPRREVSLSLDFQHCWLLLSNTSHYSSSESSTFTVSSAPVELSYPFGNTSGIKSSEVFYFPPQNLTHDFILATEPLQLYDWLAQSFEIEDGIFGLGFEGELTKNASVLYGMKQAKIISSVLVSLFLSRNETSRSSEIFFGEAEPEDYSDEDEITIKVHDFEWKCSWHNISVGNTSVATNQVVRFNPGLPYILAPPTVANELLLQISQKTSCENTSGGFFSCNLTSVNVSVLPEIHLTHKLNRLVVTAKDYFYTDENSSLLLVVANTNDSWVMGQPFFREYYSVFDFEKSKLRLFRINEKASVSSIIYIIVGIFVLVIIFVPVIVYCFISKRGPDENDLTDSLIN
jgi:hypothetical protein